MQRPGPTSAGGGASTDDTPLVAIVDDDASVRRSTERLVRSFGYRAKAFPSGEEFLNSDGATGAACVVLDVQMPGMDGLEVQRRLAERKARIPIVFITGYASDDEERRARSAGACAFLRKPVARAALLQIFEKLFHGKEVES